MWKNGSLVTVKEGPTGVYRIDGLYTDADNLPGNNEIPGIRTGSTALLVESTGAPHLYWYEEDSDTWTEIEKE